MIDDNSGQVLDALAGQVGADDEVALQALAELADRELCRRKLLHFICRANPAYIPGWVHQDICERLEKFEQDIKVAMKNGTTGPRLMITLPPRHGKEIADSTPVLTIDGWKQHGNLEVGDQVFHPSGRPIEVIALADQKHNDDYVVHFTNGEQIRCHANHEWCLYDRSKRKDITIETHALKNSDLTSGTIGKRGGRYLMQVPPISVLEMPAADQPLDPYYLGAWLGDGTSTAPTLTISPDDTCIIDHLAERGLVSNTVWEHKDTGVPSFSFSKQGIIQAIKKLGIYNNKRIPKNYIFASIDQRLDLLAGLVDTDGHVERKTGRVRIATVFDDLAEDIMTLVRTFGVEPYVYTQEPCLSSGGIQGTKPVHYVGFQPDFDIPTVVPRKKIERLAKKRRYAVARVEYSPNGEQGRCIQVDSSDGLYLVGKQLVPTHNSEIASRSFPAWYLGRNPTHEIIATSYASSLALKFSRAARTLYKSPLFNSVFPDAGLDRDAQAAENWLTRANGGYMAAGVGGPITGSGMHCIHFSVKATTKRGIIPIEEVKVGDEVLGYDHTTNSVQWTQVRAVATSYKPELVNVNGALLTPDHRVWADGEYVEAGRLENGTAQVLSLREGISEAAQRIPAKYSKIRSRDEVLLFNSMQQTAQPYYKHMPVLRRMESFARTRMQSLLLKKQNGNVVLYSMFKDLRKIFIGIQKNFRYGWKGLQNVLFTSVLRQIPNREPAYKAAGNSSLQDMRQCDTYRETQQKVLQSEVLSKTGGTRPRVQRPMVATAQKCIKTLWKKLWSLRKRKELGSGASHRSQSIESQDGQSDNALRALPQPLSSSEFGTSAKGLARLLPKSGGYRCVDLQTGLENFFAGKLLVHNCGIVDDPVKNREEAESETVRESIIDWYTSTFYTRLAPGGGILVIQTRWHEGDLAGWLLDEMARGGDHFELVNYPAIAEEDEEHRKKGEALHEARYPIDVLKQIEKVIGPRDFASLYQQRPSAAEGDQFKRSMLHYYEDKDRPSDKDMTFYQAWDFAIGQKQLNDFTVGICAGIDRNDNLWLVDLVRGKWDSLKIVDEMLDFWELWQAERVGLEHGQIAMALDSLIEKRIAERNMYGFPYNKDENLKPGRQDKVARSAAIRGRMRQRKVFIPKSAPWLSQFIDELLKFPNGNHDDQVDALSWLGIMMNLFYAPRDEAPDDKTPKWLKKLLNQGRFSQHSSTSAMSS